MSNKKCCITLGKCNRKYCFIISGIIIINLMSIFIIVLFHFYRIEHDKIYGGKTDIISILFIKYICESFMIIPDLILKKKWNQKKRKYSPRKTYH